MTDADTRDLVRLRVLEKQLCAERGRLRDALAAVLLLHGAPSWGDTEKRRWRELTGGDNASTRGLCDAVRAALGESPRASGARAVLPVTNPGIRRVLTVEEIADEIERAEYSAELLLQHLVIRYNQLRERVVARVRWVIEAKSDLRGAWDEIEVPRTEERARASFADWREWVRVHGGGWSDVRLVREVTTREIQPTP